MSFYDDASLIMIPSGYKASKLYSAKPTDGSGDLTFSRTGSTATRVNESGLIEECRTNLVLNSATLVTQNVTVVAAPYTLSIFGTGSVVLTGTGSGTLTGTGAANRVSLTFTPTAGTLILTVAGSVTSAQLEIGDIATAYIPTTAAAVTVGPIANLPRLDYTGGGCPKLLMEPTRTNTVTYSEDFTNTSYTKSLSSVSGNIAIGPDGYMSADFALPDATSSSSHRLVKTTGTSITSGVTYTTFSIFVKNGGYDYINLEQTNYGSSNITYRFSTNQITATGGAGYVAGSAKSELFANGWVRLSFTNLATLTGTITLFINFRNNAGGATFAGDGVSGIYLWGAQLEVGPYATSYIPTNNATVTRNADSASKTGISSLIGQTEGTIFVEFVLNQAPSDVNGRLLQLYATDDATNSIIPLINQSRQLQITTVGSSLSNITIPAGAGTLLGFGINKIAIGYTSTSISVYRNGVLFASGNPVGFFPASLTSLDLGCTSFSTRNLANPISKALLFKTRLSNDDLATLTTL